MRCRTLSVMSMRKLPKPSEMSVDQLMDGSADVVSLSSIQI